MKRMVIVAAAMVGAVGLGACAPVAKITATQNGGISVIGSSPTFANSAAEVMDSTHQTIDRHCGFAVIKSLPQEQDHLMRILRELEQMDVRGIIPSDLEEDVKALNDALKGIRSAVDAPKIAAETLDAIVGLIPTHIYTWSGKCL